MSKRQLLIPICDVTGQVLVAWANGKFSINLFLLKIATTFKLTLLVKVGRL